ncbi:GNAT family N-acetyltransferase [Cytobacillus kochii]|uniref:GNAT family N-acetyltransferase n=1 Tax=Cytobacillus kochii TaxID=859143 RepID=UPI0025A2E602|nr:GNAT family N-acetyltransferase [Cytobacillus kochii]MDM5207638.1 GNAT family N-acetyltransferase [Cytobacillus kochii]
MSIQIRNATEGDFSTIQLVARLSWAEAYRELIPVSVQKKYLQTAYSIDPLRNKLETTAFLVGEWEEKVVSFANLHCSKNENDLSAIYIHPKFQSKGLGSALLNNIKNKLQNGDELVVYLEKGNHQAESFYRKHGFTYIEEFSESFFDHTFKTVKMSVII